MELIQGRKTKNQITAESGVHPTQQNKRKEEFIREGALLFDRGKDMHDIENEKKIEKLHKGIGQYAVEGGWLQKKLLDTSSYADRVNMIENHQKMLLSGNLHCFVYQDQGTTINHSMMKMV